MSVSRDLLGLQYNADFLEIYGSLKSWYDKDPDRGNEIILPLIQDLLRIDTYVKTFQNERISYDRIISEAIDGKNRAIIRSRKSEEEIERLTKELKKYKQIENLNL